MPLIKTNLEKIDISKLYKKQIKNSTFKSKSSKDWDKKAQFFNENAFASSYTKDFIDKIDLSDCETLLDVGSGPATISLALASKLKTVYALDYSQEMLNLAQNNAEKLHINNLVTIHKSWYHSWKDVPKADIVVASRSMDKQTKQQSK